MGYQTLTNKDGKNYVATCCNVVAQLIETRIDSEIIETRKIRDSDVEFKVTSRTHIVRCPNYHCGRDFEVNDVVDERLDRKV